jgi:hypothetical protein
VHKKIIERYEQSLKDYKDSEFMRDEIEYMQNRREANALTVIELESLLDTIKSIDE